jgi:enoyl-CoA hydratase/carnithine racemase
MTPLLEIRREGRLLRMALNRPEKRNALNAALCRDLTEALAEAQKDPAVGAVLLSGNGKSFSAGMDLEEAQSANAGSLADVHERLFTAFDWLRKPLIAAVHGAALAGGTGLVANAHIVIAAADSTFGLTEIRLGLWPFVIFRAAVRALGERRAVELSLTGRIFGAAEALSYGLVHHVASAERAVELAAEVADASPAAISSGLDFACRTRGLAIEDAGRLARSFREQIFAGDDFRQRLEKFQRRLHGKP